MVPQYWDLDDYQPTRRDMNPNPRFRTLLLCLAIVAALCSVLAYQEAGEVFTLVGGSWLAICGALVAGALL